MASCALQGQPFNWCRVGTEEAGRRELCVMPQPQEPCGNLEAAADPTGRDHALGISRQWDYCVPPHPEAGEGQAAEEELNLGRQNDTKGETF